MLTIGTPWMWGGFIVFVLAMLVLDLGVFHRNAHTVKVREALAWSVVWVSISLLFNLWVGYEFGRQHALEFFAGYLLEKALSVDNLFIFLVIFSTFAVPKVLQHRVLFWGILGALVLRAVFIFMGAALMQSFHWIMYVFGAVLVITGAKLFLQRDEEAHPEKNIFVRWFKKFFPVSRDYHGQKFFVIQNGRRYATPLLVVLVAVEGTDIIFAFDSIPAIFAVTQDPFIVFTSNIFAILGLRSLFFLLSGIMDRFHYLKIGLAGILVFIGIKLIIIDFYKIPIGISLAVIATTLTLSMLFSWMRPKPIEK